MSVMVDGKAKECMRLIIKGRISKRYRQHYWEICLYFPYREEILNLNLDERGWGRGRWGRGRRVILSNVSISKKDVFPQGNTERIYLSGLYGCIHILKCLQGHEKRCP